MEGFTMAVKKLKFNNINKISLTDGSKHDLGVLKFDLSQFKIPKDFVILKNEVTAKAEKEKNRLGELVETGLYNIEFKAYDRSLVEVAITNNLTEYGSPITITIEKQDSLTILDDYEDDEFIPLTFEKLTVRPRKVQRKVYSDGKSVDSWQFAELRVSADSYKVGE